MGGALRQWSVEALNLPEHADNPIHTDDGARSAGFAAALVAGTTVHAYLTRPVVEAWGSAWLAEGASTLELLAPVEAGERLDCVPVSGLDGLVEVKGEVRGDLRARLVAHRRKPEGFSYEDRAGEVLPARLEALDGAHADYARRAGEDLGLYAQEGLVHPCAWPTLANAVFVRHLVDGPWIHTRSRIVHHAAVAVGESVLVEATVVDRLEARRGTRVVVDVEVSLDGIPVASVRHEALVHLRPEVSS